MDFSNATTASAGRVHNWVDVDWRPYTDTYSGIYGYGGSGGSNATSIDYITGEIHTLANRCDALEEKCNTLTKMLSEICSWATQEDIERYIKAISNG